MLKFQSMVLVNLESTNTMGMKMMGVKECVCIVAIATLIVGCGSSQRKVNKSEISVNKERLSLVEDYQKCLQKAGADAEASEACDRYLKAAEVLQ
jgi:hypothetical protein